MNLHYEFWVKYFEKLYQGEISEEEVQANNNKISLAAWAEPPQQTGRLIPLQDTAVYMKVGYPGLLVGLGDSHESNHCPNDAPEIVLGFSLDPVTGLPVIPGSQVKGMLRSAFIQNTGYIAELLGWEEKPREWIVRLENEIFGTKNPKDPRADCKMDEHGGRDVFLDAYPVIPSGRRLVGIEAITPHRSANGAAYSRLSEPTPLHLLKVMPDTTIQFRFVLTDSVVAEGITVSAAQKKELFASIIEDLGAGAKTSVGFGAMQRVDPQRSDFRYLVRTGALVSQAASMQSQRQPQRNAPPAAQNVPVSRTVAEIIRPSQIRVGMRLKGVCQKKDNPKSKTGRILLLQKPEVYGIAELNGMDVPKYKEGESVIVRVVSIGTEIKVALE